jgi:hypothetical protein
VAGCGQAFRAQGQPGWSQSGSPLPGR